MRICSLLLRLAALDLVLLCMLPETAAASLQWSWRYEGAGISARGTLTTSDVANSSGYFQITGITGTRNGITITGLQPAGTAIPGNEPYAVDNLISSKGQQLTGNGFGFALADGTFSNPFFAHNHTPPAYLEFFSAPRSGHGNHSELAVHFVARIMQPVREKQTGSVPHALKRARL